MSASNLQVEGAFVQGIGYFVTEGVQLTEDGKEMAEGTWDYKVPTVDTIMKRFHVELYNSATLKDRILSSKCKLHHVDWLELNSRHNVRFIRLEINSSWPRMDVVNCSCWRGTEVAGRINTFRSSKSDSSSSKAKKQMGFFNITVHWRCEWLPTWPSCFYGQSEGALWLRQCGIVFGVRGHEVILLNPLSAKSRCENYTRVLSAVTSLSFWPDYELGRREANVAILCRRSERQKFCTHTDEHSEHLLENVSLHY